VDPEEQSLRDDARAVTIVTAFVVALLSPLSSLAAFAFGWSVAGWLDFWTKYVFLFIIAAIAVAAAGFSQASSLRRRADAGREAVS
jgi:hypothetical protein